MRFYRQPFLTLAAIMCATLLQPNCPLVFAQQPAASPEGAATEQAPKIPNDQLDSLVAPIALYPDPLLAQTLAASTYPLEIIQLQQWLVKNPNLKGKALADAVAKQNWDPSVQAMASVPDALKRLAENISWTTDLGNAFLSQQADVMAAVQRMRVKAQGAGTLKTSQQQKVESKPVEGKNVIVIEQADPQVVYVPSYNPTVVYGASAYPYPSIYYPPPGYYAAGAALAFGAGVAIGAAWNGGWGWNCGWGHNDVNVNINNNYINNFNKKNVNNRIANNSAWQHNPQHRGGAPYANRQTANKFGGTARGGPASTRPAGGRQGITAGREGIAGAGSRPGGGIDRPGGGDGIRPGGGGGDRFKGGGGGDHIGNRQVSRGGGGKSNNAFHGGGGGFNRSSAMASHSRGSMSMGRGGGGMHRGGGRRR